MTLRRATARILVLLVLALQSTVRFMKNLWRGEGASAAKYALILAIVGAGIAAARPRPGSRRPAA